MCVRAQESEGERKGVVRTLGGGIRLMWGYLGVVEGRK